MKIKKILVSQEKLVNEKSPFDEIAAKNNIEITYMPFIKTESVSVEEFRKTRIKIDEYTALIFTNKTSVDHFFNLCTSLRIPVRSDIKYFCRSKSVATYLHKYIIYRKRKVIFDEQKNAFSALLPYFEKYSKDKYLLPVSNTYSGKIPTLLRKLKIKFQKCVMYRTVNCDLSEIEKEHFDIIVFYSPNSVKSLLENFPNFEQGTTLLASFGKSTAKAIRDAGLKVNIKAPTAGIPSMKMALEVFLRKHKKIS